MFGKSITLFRLLGFRVKADASLLLLAVLVAWSLAVGFFPQYVPGQKPSVYWLMGAVGVLGLFLSIVVHEFCHSLVARHYGLPIGGITLFVFGGVAEMQDEPKGAKTEFLMAVAGPLSSALLAAIFRVFHLAGEAQGWAPWLSAIFYYLAWLNITLAVFNLLPAFPLDGGRMLRAVLWGMGKNLHRATRTASGVGKGFGVGLMILGVITGIGGYPITGIWWLLIGLFLRTAADTSYRQMLLRESVQGMPVRAFMTSSPVTVAPTSTLQEFFDHYAYRHHHRLYPVVENGHLLGMVRASSGRNVEPSQWGRRLVGEFIEAPTPDNTIDADLDAARALAQMIRTGNSRLLVMEHGSLAGVLTFRDLAAALRMREEED